MPSAAAVAAAPAAEEIPLTPELQALIDDWEDARGQAAQLRFIRTRLAAGRSPAEILREITAGSAS